jgi:hypothetical protein
MNTRFRQALLTYFRVPTFVAAAFLVATFLALFVPARSMAQISVNVSVNTPPPELPVYDQPPIPADGYVWTPGYWYWDDDIQDYYWVPGTWVLAPQPEYLWTPGYWGTEGAVFLWHGGYWGPHVGFYGGVNYGYGYGGNGYEGGYWQGGRLYYNRSVNNIGNVQITNVYNKSVINNVTVNRVSYNGGSGIHAEPTAAQLAAAQDRHIQATPLQQQHVQMARSNPSLRASQNNGRPPIAATPRPAVFSGSGVVRAHNSPAAGRDAEAHAPLPQHPSVQQHPAVEQHPWVEQHPSVEQHPPVQQHAPVQQRSPVEQRAPQQRPPAEQRRAPEVAPPEHQSAPRGAEHPPEH